MQTLLTATGLVALAEIGDKTQLLSLVLAARYRRPGPILAGILVATLANHALAGGLGVWLASLLTPTLLGGALAVSFLAMAVWMLIPDELDDVDAGRRQSVFVATLIAFFLAEMGDKTQIATIALAARFDDYLAIVAGTTLGMMAANAPAVLLGHQAAHRLPVRAVHAVAAGIFALLGVWTLVEVSGLWR